MDWKSCKTQGFAKEVSEDKNLMSSLVRGAMKKLHAQELLELNEATTTAKVSLAYDALRELLEAAAMTNRYKIYNHECYAAFLEEIVKESALARRFNKLRKIRNDIT